MILSFSSPLSFFLISFIVISARSLTILARAKTDLLACAGKHFLFLADAKTSCAFLIRKTNLPFCSSSLNSKSLFLQSSSISGSFSSKSFKTCWIDLDKSELIEIILTSARKRKESRYWASFSLRYPASLIFWTSKSKICLNLSAPISFLNLLSLQSSKSSSSIAKSQKYLYSKLVLHCLTASLSLNPFLKNWIKLTLKTSSGRKAFCPSSL